MLQHAGLILCLALVATASASCGGTGSIEKAPAGSQSPLTSAQPPDADGQVTAPRGSERQTGGSGGSSGKRQSTTVAEPSRKVDREAARQQQRETPQEKSGGEAASPAPSICRLVSTSEASTILGAAVQTPVVAKQGPTCLYRTRDGDLTTVSVQAVALREITAHMRNQRNVAVGTRSGVCGKFDQPMLFMPLGRGRVLAVAAGCDVARQFASQALPRLSRSSNAGGPGEVTR